MHRWSHRRPRRVARRHLPGAPLRRPHGGTAVARGLTRLLRRRHAGSVVTSPTVEAAIGWRSTMRAAAPRSARTSGTSCSTRNPPTEEAPWNTGSHSRRIPNLTEGPYKTTASSSSNRAASGSRFSLGYARSAPGSSGSNSSRSARTGRRGGVGSNRCDKPWVSLPRGHRLRARASTLSSLQTRDDRGPCHGPRPWCGRHGRPAVCQPRKSSSARLNCSGWVALRPCGPPSISGSELPSIAS